MCGKLSSVEKSWTDFTPWSVPIQEISVWWRTACCSPLFKRHWNAGWNWNRSVNLQMPEVLPTPPVNLLCICCKIVIIFGRKKMVKMLSTISGIRRTLYMGVTGWKNTERTTSDRRCPNSSTSSVKTPRISLRIPAVSTAQSPTCWTRCPQWTVKVNSYGHF